MGYGEMEDGDWDVAYVALDILASLTSTALESVTHLALDICTLALDPETTYDSFLVCDRLSLL